MFLVPDKLIWIAEPRTASRTTAAALRSAGYQQINDSHHPDREDVIDAKLKYKLPVVANLRNPAHLICSRLNMNGRGREFRTGQERNQKLIMMIRRGANINSLDIRYTVYRYADVVDEWYPLEFGLESMFAHYGIEAEVRESIGRDPSNIPSSFVRPEHEAMVKSLHPKDWALYEKWMTHFKNQPRDKDVQQRRADVSVVGSR